MGRPDPDCPSHPEGYTDRRCRLCYSVSCPYCEGTGRQLGKEDDCRECKGTTRLRKLKGGI